MMKFTTASLIYNPNAGSRHGDQSIITQLATELQRSGIAVTMHATQSGGDASRLARAAVAEKYDVLIVCGGDGTINEAAQEMIGSATALAVFPCGTANVFAKDLGLTRDPKKVSQLIASGQTQTISVGRASKPEDNWQRFFLLMAGIGLDAAMVNNVNLDLKRRIGKGAYFAAAMDYLMRWPLTPFTLGINGQSYDATYATIANSPSYGGGFTLAPGARLEDDKLDVCIFNSHSRLEYIGYAALAIRGNHTNCKNVTYLETQAVIAEAGQETFVQLDGELVGTLPMQFEIVPHALRVLAPGT